MASAFLSKLLPPERGPSAFGLHVVHPPAPKPEAAPPTASTGVPDSDPAPVSEPSETQPKVHPRIHKPKWHKLSKCLQMW